jgi:arginyl-tRNA synthetase
VSDRLRTELSRVASRLGADGLEFVLERPRDAGHGDLATNLAMVLARRDRANPRKTAERVLQELQLPTGLVAKTEIAGPGFINFWLADSQLADAHRRILEQGADYGRSTRGANLRVNVEFVSANPTGPLHVGHGRGAALGDAIASLLEWTDHSVTREFYVNDAGVQIEKLARSHWARVREVAGHKDTEIPEGGYHGEYLLENARQVLASEGRAFADLPEADGIGRSRLLALAVQREEQDRDLELFGVKFDVTSSEQASYDSGRVDRAIALLAERGLTYESEGALWLRTTTFGDDKDRVLRKSDGSLTYLAPDIA